jgi:hypothetical protein
MKLGERLHPQDALAIIMSKELVRSEDTVALRQQLLFCSHLVDHRDKKWMIENHSPDQAVILSTLLSFLFFPVLIVTEFDASERRPSLCPCVCICCGGKKG